MHNGSCSMENGLEEGRNRSRESNQEASVQVQVRLDGGLSHVGKVKMDLGGQFQVIASWYK